MGTDLVVLVDEWDRDAGTMEKISAHRQGLLHRAFSVCVFNSAGELLIHRRAPGKYHSPGLWTNTCCSHPAPGEPPMQAAERRLREEMGFTCPLRHAFSFIYRAELDNGLWEHEFDHVFIGEWDGIPAPNPEEVDAYRYAAPDELMTEMEEKPELYTAWFRLLLPRIARMDTSGSKLI